MPDGQPGGFIAGSIMPAQGQLHTSSMQYRGAIPPGPPPRGIMSGSTTGEMPQMSQMIGTSLRGPLYQLSSPGTPLQAIGHPGPPPTGNQVRAALAHPPNMPPSGSVLRLPPTGPPPSLHDTIHHYPGHFMPPPLAAAVSGSHPMGASEFHPNVPSSLGNSVSSSTPGIMSFHHYQSKFWIHA